MKRATIQNVNESLSFMTTASFAVPEIGPILAAGIGGIDFLFNLLAHPTAPPLSTAPPPLNQTDLDALLAEIVAKMQENTLRDEFYDITNINTNLIQNWQLIEDELPKWSPAQVLKAKTKPGWQTMIETEQKNMVDSANPITDFIGKCLKLDDQEFALPLFMYAVNTYILQARVCILGEYALLQLDHDLAKARAKLDAAVTKHMPGQAAKTRKSVARGALDAIHNHKVDLTTDNPQLPDDVKAAARDVIEAMPARDAMANASAYVAKLKKNMVVWHDHLRKLVIVDDKALKGTFADMLIQRSDRKSSFDAARKIQRITPAGRSDHYRIDKPNAFTREWVVDWITWQYMPGAYAKNIGATDALMLSQDEQEMMRRAEKTYDDMAINTASALLAYQQSDAQSIGSDVAVALKYLG